MAARGTATQARLDGADERYQRLQATQVVQVSTQKTLSPTSLWDDGHTAFCVWGRSMG